MKNLKSMLILSTVLVTTSLIGCQMSSKQDLSSVRKLEVNGQYSYRTSIETMALLRLSEALNIPVNKLEYNGEAIKEYDSETNLIEDYEIMGKVLDKRYADINGFEFQFMDRLRETIGFNVEITKEDKEKYFDMIKFYYMGEDGKEPTIDKIPGQAFIEAKTVDILEQLILGATNSVVLDLAKDNAVTLKDGADKLVTLDSLRKDHPEYFDLKPLPKDTKPEEGGGEGVEIPAPETNEKPKDIEEEKEQTIFDEPKE